VQEYHNKNGINKMNVILPLSGAIPFRLSHCLEYRKF